MDLLLLPLLACLVLTGIHAYLGIHILARGVIFVDLALAQIAALGATVAFLLGHPLQSDAAYWYALAFASAGAAVFAVTRPRSERIPHEAIIGIVYVASAAAAVLAVDRAPQGAEYIKAMLVGNILTVTEGTLARTAGVYAALGGLHWILRRRFLQISLDPAAAAREGRRVRAWDFLFYLTFGVVVTSSVRIAGVLLVFAFLIIPAAAGALYARAAWARLLLGWGVGTAASLGGLAASFAWNLPTGAALVCSFVLALCLAAGARALAPARLARLDARHSDGAGDHHPEAQIEDQVPGPHPAPLPRRAVRIQRDLQKAAPQDPMQHTDAGVEACRTGQRPLGHREDVAHKHGLDVLGALGRPVHRQHGRRRRGHIHDADDGLVRDPLRAGPCEGEEDGAGGGKGQGVPVGGLTLERVAQEERHGGAQRGDLGEGQIHEDHAPGQNVDAQVCVDPG